MLLQRAVRRRTWTKEEAEQLTQEDLEVAQYVGGINTSEYQHMAEAVAKSSQQYEKVQAIKHSGLAKLMLQVLYCFFSENNSLICWEGLSMKPQQGLISRFSSMMKGTIKCLL